MNPSIYANGLGGSTKISYTVSEFGGSIGRIELPLVFPANSVIFTAFANKAMDEQGVLTRLASEGAATVRLSIEGESDLTAASPFGEFNVYKLLLPTLASPIITTQRRQLLLDIAGANLVSGGFDIFIEYRNGVDVATPIVSPTII